MLLQKYYNLLTKWVSNQTSCKEFLKNYKHYYNSELEGYGSGCYSYKIPPIQEENIMRLDGLNSFYPKFDLLNGV